LRDIAAKVGMSHVTPYRYFKSKDELFAAIRTDLVLAFGERFERVANGPGKPLERLRRIMLTLVEAATRNPADYRLIFSLRQPPLRQHPPLLSARVRVMDQITAAYQAAIDAGELKGDAATMAHVAWVAFHGLLSLHVGHQLVYGKSLRRIVIAMLDTLLPDSGNAQVRKTRAATPSRRSPQ
jgi:AcrR family transcriptional regulator